MTIVETSDLPVKLLELGTASIGLVSALATAGLLAKPAEQAANAVISAEGLRKEQKEPIRQSLLIAKRARLLLMWVSILATVAAVGMFFLYSRKDTGISPSLAQHDPALFSGSPNQTYEISRVFPNRSDLQQNGSLGQIFENTNHDFDLFAMSAQQTFNTFSPRIEDLIINKGVTFRIVLFDAGESNAHNCEVLAATLSPKMACQNLRSRMQETVGRLEDLQQRVRNSSSAKKGAIEFRFWQAVTLYSFWIKDRKEKSAMANIEIHQYRDRSYWPSFRVGRDSADLVDNFAQEFDEIWNRSTGSPSSPVATSNATTPQAASE